jgi:hypothetical protein
MWINISQSVSITDTRIASCSAPDAAGGCWIRSGNGCTSLTRVCAVNCSTGNVGSFFLRQPDGSDANFTLCQVFSCSGALGTIYIGDSLPCFADNLNVSYCTAGSSGSAIFVSQYSSPFQLGDSTISNCTSENDALYWVRPSAICRRVTFFYIASVFVVTVPSAVEVFFHDCWFLHNSGLDLLPNTPVYHLVNCVFSKAPITGMAPDSVITITEAEVPPHVGACVTWAFVPSQFHSATGLFRISQEFAQSSELRYSPGFPDSGSLIATELLKDVDPAGSGSSQVGMVLGIVFGLIFMVAVAVAGGVWAWRRRMARPKEESVDDGDHMAEFYDRLEREKQDQISVDFHNPMYTNSGLIDEKVFASDGGVE